MIGNLLIRVSLLGACAIAFAPTPGSASQVNISVTPVRPQIHLSPSLRMDVRSRDIYDLDISNDCRADERFKKRKRERRCREDR